MNETPDADILLEAERYELHAGPLYHFDLDRREFFRVLGCGLVVLFLVDQVLGQESGGGGRRRGGGSRPQEISAWLHIGEDGTVTVFTGKAEVGQNIRTSLAQAVSEELLVPLSAIKLVMADTALTPYDAGTFGSRTTPDMNAQLRKVAAAAREALLDLAADQWKTERAGLSVTDGKVVRAGSKDTLSFVELTKDQKLVASVNEKTPVKSARDWQVAGTSPLKANGRDFVTGTHKYSSDIRRPGMVHGKVLRPDSFGAKIKSADLAAAKRLPKTTVLLDGEFIGVTAPDIQAASRALSALKVEWISTPQISNAELTAHFKKTGRSGGGGFTSGEMEKGLAAADHQLEQSYPIAYIAHAPLEPRAAVAEWADDKLTVWTGTQRPFGVRGDLAQALGIPEDHVRVIVPDTGSGYGGKHTGEAAIEAARLAKAAGKPVKLVWTREEEMTWAYFRPGGLIEIKSGVRKDGILTAWEFHNYNSGGSAIRTPYEIPNQKIEFHGTDSPLRQGSYRGLAATANHFAREAHMDELAHVVEIDPLEFRLKNLKDSRLRAVLQAAADGFGWGKEKSTPDKGFGLSVGTEKGSYVGTCAEVAIDRDRGSVKVTRVTAAFECGAIVNPEHLKNQIEGSIVMGIGGALFEAIQFENGKIKNSHFSRYRVPRFNDAPQIDVVLVNRKDLASTGAGETPIVGIAPAIGNAIFAATGTRLRTLPMTPNGLKA